MSILWGRDNWLNANKIIVLPTVLRISQEIDIEDYSWSEVLSNMVEVEFSSVVQNMMVDNGMHMSLYSAI